jgi:hypothetical protein
MSGFLQGDREGTERRNIELGKTMLKKIKKEEELITGR